MALSVFHLDTDTDVLISQDGGHASSTEATNKWSGARSQSGILRGAYHFEVELESPCLLRVGWAASGSKGAIGMDARSFGFGGTGMKCNRGRFSKYGECFKDQVGAVVGCLIDRRTRSRQTISYSLNGRSLGVAFRLPDGLVDVPLYPSVVGNSIWRAALRWDHLVFPDADYQPVAASALPGQAIARSFATLKPPEGSVVTSGEHIDVLPERSLELALNLKTSQLRVVPSVGAGLELAPCEFGFMVLCADEWPRQPDIRFGDVILAIGQQSLVRLQPEEVERRFGHSYHDGATIIIGACSALSSVGSRRVQYEVERHLQLLSKVTEVATRHFAPLAIVRSEASEDDRFGGSTASGPASESGDALLDSDEDADFLRGLVARDPHGFSTCASAVDLTVEQVVRAGTSVLAEVALREGRLRVRRRPQGSLTAGLELEPSSAGFLVRHINEWPRQPDLRCSDVIVAVGGLVLVGLSDGEMERRFRAAYKDGVTMLVGHRTDLDQLPIEFVRLEADRRASSMREGDQAIVIVSQEISPVFNNEVSQEMEAIAVGCNRAMVAPQPKVMRAGQLKVTSVGAGLELEPSELGFRVCHIDPHPGQPDLRVDDVIMVIGAEPLVGLDSDELERRFGKGFVDGAHILVGRHNELAGFVNKGRIDNSKTC